MDSAQWQFAKGMIIVDANAAMALRGDKAVSLLPIGISEIKGEWDEGRWGENREGIHIGSRPIPFFPGNAL